MCHIIHSLERGGAEHLLVELAEVARAASLELAVISLMPVTGDGYHDRLTKLGVDVRCLELPTRWDPRSMTRATAAVRQLQPDVLHAHMKHADLVGAYVARRLHLPLISSLHAIEDAVSSVGRAKRWLGAQARLRAPDLTIAVSDAVRDWYLATFHADPEAVVTLHNGVGWPELGADARATTRRQLGVGDETVVATMLSVMRPNKGHAQLLAASRLLPAELDLLLVMAGDGPLRDELERDCVGPNADKVLFAGWRTDVAELLTASDLIVHSSLSEALPTALIQGLAAGLPAVASDVGGIPEIVTPLTGILVPPDNAAALAAAIVAVADDPDRRRAMGLAARARFVEEFDSHVWVQRLRARYDQVLGV